MDMNTKILLALSFGVLLVSPLPTFAVYEGELYDTSSQNTSASLIRYVNQQEKYGVETALRFFSIEYKPYEDLLVSHSDLGFIVNAVQTYPGHFVPFFSLGISGSEANDLSGKTLHQRLLARIKATKEIVGTDFLQGLGEVEQYAWDAGVDSTKLHRLYGMADNQNIHLMIHTKGAETAAFGEIAETYPDVTFLLHAFRMDADQYQNEIIELLTQHDNVYFSIDADHMLFDTTGDFPVGLLFKYEDLPVSEAVEQFKDQYAALHDQLLADAVTSYKPIVDAAPRKVMWGTESYPAYNYHPDVYKRIINFSRQFIAQLEAEDQEKFAYKNAKRVFGSGLTLTEEIPVIDTSDWSECTDKQITKCEDSCDSNRCMQSCLINKECTVD